MANPLSLPSISTSSAAVAGASRSIGRGGKTGDFSLGGGAIGDFQFQTAAAVVLAGAALLGLGLWIRYR